MPERGRGSDGAPSERRSASPVGAVLNTNERVFPSRAPPLPPIELTAAQKQEKTLQDALHRRKEAKRRLDRRREALKKLIQQMSR